MVKTKLVEGDLLATILHTILYYDQGCKKVLLSRAGLNLIREYIDKCDWHHIEGSEISLRKELPESLIGYFNGIELHLDDSIAPEFFRMDRKHLETTAAQEGR